MFKNYVVSKQFHLYWAPGNTYLRKNDYGVTNSKPIACKEKVGLKSINPCNNSTISEIKYDEYKLWNNFSLIYKNKMYDHTDYEILNDGIKICNNIDDYARNIWKIGNQRVKQKVLKDCDQIVCLYICMF